jgi:ABC-2 type transport system ATP-binding protein
MKWLIILLLLQMIFSWQPAIGYAEELMFFSDDHYKAIGQPLLRAAAINPAIEPGTNTTLHISVANDGLIEELIPNKPGDPGSVSSEAKEELHNVDALNITARLSGDGPVVVVTAPYKLTSLPAGEMTQLDFNITTMNGAIGWYNLLLETEYEHQIDFKVGDRDNSSLFKPSSMKQKITVLVQEPVRSFAVEGVVSDLRPGSNGTILAVIKNNGLDFARNCSARLIAMPPFRSNSGAREIGDLQPGEAVVASFPVALDEGAVFREFQLFCEINHDNQTTTISFPVLLNNGSGILYGNIIIVSALFIGAAGGTLLLWKRRQHVRRSRRVKRWQWLGHWNAMTEISVKAVGICKEYKSLFGKISRVLNDVSLEIQSDEIFGIIGPNGSGKTTLISIFSTLIYPEKGRLRVLGMDPRIEKDAIRKKINISSAKANFPWSLTVRENLQHYAMLYGMYGSELKRTVDDQIESFELGDYRDVRFEDLSTGLKQRLSLAKAMLNNPRLVFLDEPTTGLDPEIAKKTRELILRIHRENDVSVIMSTHYMPEAEILCDRIAFLRQGCIVEEDTPQNLKNQLHLGERMMLYYEGSVEIDELKQIPGVMNVKAEPGRLEIVMDRTADNVDRIIKLFKDAKIQNIEIKEPDLEDVFLELAR